MVQTSQEQGDKNVYAEPEEDDAVWQAISRELLDGVLGLPSDKVDQSDRNGKDAQKLEGEELNRARYLQDTLKSLATVYLDAQHGDKKEILQTKEQLQKERDAGVFGPATREAYKKYVNWLEKAVPETIREMSSLERALPPGCPIELPLDRYDRPISPELFRALSAEGKVSLDMKLTTDKVPTDKQLDKLSDAYSWLGASNESAAAALNKQRDVYLNKLIADNGLGEKWKLREGDDPANWRASAAEMIDLAVRTRNYVEATLSLYKRGDFPLDLPPGTRLIIEGRKEPITDRELNDQSIRDLLKKDDTRISAVKLDLPEDLRQESVANGQKIDRLRAWLGRHGDKVDQAVRELVKVEKNPESVVMFGDQEVGKRKAVLDSDGNFVRLLNGPAKNGEVTKDTNLLGYDFKVEQLSDGPLKGKYKITQTIQAENAPIWAYQNIRALGIEQVGKPMQVDERLSPERAAAHYGVTLAQLKEMIEKKQLQTEKDKSGKEVVICPKILDGDSFVPVKNGGGIEIMKAKELESFKTMQQVWYYGEKSISITMDAAMFVSGTIEVHAAYKAAQVAAAGVRLTGTQALKEMGKGSLRAGVALAGVFNNAGARDNPINVARGLYFLGDIGQGVVRSSWSAVRGAKGAESAVSSADKLHSVIHGRKAVDGEAALKGLAWIREAHTATGWAFKATEVASVPGIVSDLKHEVSTLHGHRNDSLKDAVMQVGDGRGLQIAKPGAFNVKDSKALEASAKVLDGFAAVLSEGRKEATKEQVEKIFRQLKTLMAPDSTEKQKDEFRRELVRNVMLTPAQVKELESLYPSPAPANRREYEERKPFQFSENQIEDLNDPEKRKTFPKAVREHADRLLEKRDKDLSAASSIALLYLARDKDGKLPAVLGVDSQTIPEHTFSYQVASESPGGGVSERKVTIPERTIKQAVTVSNLVRDLKQDLEASPGNRGIVTGELLTRIGAISHRQYAAVLQDVLLDPASTRQDKLRALHDSNGPRLASMVDGLRYEDDAISKQTLSLLERHRAGGRRFGLSADDLLKTLKQVATTDKSPDVKSMAAGMLYGLQERDVARRGELLARFNEIGAAAEKPGAVAEKVSVVLKKEMNADVGRSDRSVQIGRSRLNAALALASIKGDNSTEKEVTQSLLKTFGRADAALAVDVLAALTPERREEIRKEDPEQVNKLSLQAVQLIKSPTSHKQESVMLALLEKVVPLVKDSDREVKLQFIGKLHDLLRNSELNKSYARDFPELRVAAISILGQEAFHTAATVGSAGSSSLDIVRSHASVLPKVKFGNREIKCGEPDAAVRLAAVRTLEQMKDPQMRSFLTAVMDKETDAAVARQLRDVQFTKERIEPSSREYAEMYGRARADVIQFGDKYKYLKDFDDKARRAWIEEKFPLLGAESYKAKLNDAVHNSYTLLGYWSSWGSTLLDYEKQAAKDVVRDREDQWNELCKLAREGDESGNKAKLALYYILTHDGQPIGSKSGDNLVKSRYDSNVYHKFYEPNWQERAARELATVAAETPGGKDIVAHCLQSGLTINEQLSKEARVYLLSGWRRLAESDKNGHSISREQLATVTMDALKTEIRRQKANQSVHFQEMLINDLRKYEHRRAFPLVEAMKDSSDNSVIRKISDKLLSDLRDSVKIMWKETAADTLATPNQRAARLQEALDDKNNAEVTVQEIFKAYKGYTIKEPTDPGLAKLYIALNDQNQRVRLAAARVLMASELPAGNAVKARATEALVELTVTGTATAYRKEAYELLNNMELKGPLVVGSPVRRLYKLEPGTQGLRVTEFLKGKPAGYVYPTGGSFRIEYDKSGEPVQVVEDGVTWTRKKDGDRLIDQWHDAMSKTTKNGTYKLLPGGRYQSPSAIRNANGTWAPSGS